MLKDQGKTQENRTQGLPEQTPESAQEAQGIFTELEEEIYTMIPTKYRDLPVELLEEFWTQPMSTDEIKNKVFRQQKQLVVDFIRMNDRRRQAAAKKAKEHFDTTEKLEETRKEIGLPVTNESRDTVSPKLASHELNNTELHAFGTLEKDGMEIVFLNNDHGQDAFAVHGDTCVISDGASSYGKAGSLSKLLSAEVAERVSKTSIESVFTKESLGGVIAAIQNNPTYQNEEPVKSFAVKNPDNERAGLATVLAVKMNKAEQTLSYASIGDSPLFVIDRDASGNLVSFQILNEDRKITNANYMDKDNLENMESPETHLIGLRGNGKMTLSSVESKKQGTIEYKKGRVILLASDALIKLLICTPEVIENKATGNPKAAALFKNIQDRYETDHSKLWIQNPATGKKMMNPLFFTSIPKAELALVLENWKADNGRAADDMTMIALDLDRQFKN